MVAYPDITPTSPISPDSRSTARNAEMLRLPYTLEALSECVRDLRKLTLRVGVHQLQTEAVETGRSFRDRGIESTLESQPPQSRRQLEKGRGNEFCMTDSAFRSAIGKFTSALEMDVSRYLDAISTAGNA